MAWIIGGPGSGKTTQSLKIAKQYGFSYIDPGALAKKQEESGKTSKEVLKRGSQVPLEYIIPLIETKINSARSKGVVIDGYPGSLEDAVALETSIGQPDIVIALQVDEETSSRRSAVNQEFFYRPTLAEYLTASRAVIERYGDITVQVDSCQGAQQVFEVIQFNIDALNMAEARASKARDSRASRLSSRGSKYKVE